jgi:outer membrane receptor protein involved in Fe transport
MTQPNPDLKPEKAKITTLGFVYEPTQWLSVSADYWFIYRSNEIVAPDFTRDEDIISSTRSPITESDRANLAALAAMCADPASGVACPGTLPGYSVGNVASVVGQYKNRGKTLIDGFDIDARSRFSLGEWGNLNIGVAATIARRKEAYIDDTDRWYYGNTIGYYGNPRMRATFNADWSYKQVTTSFFVNYVGGTKIVDLEKASAPDEPKGMRCASSLDVRGRTKTFRPCPVRCGATHRPSSSFPLRSRPPSETVKDAGIPQGLDDWG